MLCAAVLIAGCGAASGEDSADHAGDPDEGAAGEAAECAIDSDCTAAGDSCCECPTFAVPLSSGWDDSCEDVTGCETPASCPTEAACDQGRCVLRCRAVVCAGDSSCEAGFARDADGCLTCECATPPADTSPECDGDGDCVQVPADCCGCANGGVDTAVAADRADDFAEGLGCDTPVSCPGVDVCDRTQVAQCVAGTCRLVPQTDAPTDPDGGPGGGALRFCGTPELPPCGPQESCVVNDPDSPQASEMNVGVCR